MELLIFFVLYLITLGFYAYIKNPTLKFYCRDCDKIVKGYLYHPCECGKNLCRTNIASDYLIFRSSLLKYGIIKKLDK